MYCLRRLPTVFLFMTSALAQTCYFPNGDVSGLDTACNPNSLVSVCCFDGQACLSNGLCVSDPHDPDKARLHRGTCTDKSWKSGNCLRECLDVDNNGVPVYGCNQTNSDSYCCYDNCQCDSSRFDVFSFASASPSTVTIIGESFTASSTTPTPSSGSSTPTSASASTTAASTMATASSTASSAPASDNNSSSTNKTAIGVGVGVGIPVIALIGVGAFFLFRRRKRNEAYVGDGTTKHPAEVENSQTYYSPVTKYAHYAGPHEKGDVESHTTPLGATTATTELPAQSYDPIELPASPPPKPDAPVKK